jgi:7-cyano-7-deazaguanine synthase
VNQSPISAFQLSKPRTPNAPAVILFSGGLDSTTILALAKHLGYRCFALSINYGQKHSSELEAAKQIALSLGVEQHEMIHLDLPRFGGSALTDHSLHIPTSNDQANLNTKEPVIPITYVPARNTIMLSLALAWAESIASLDIFYGANAVDYSGYPDCRPEYVRSFEAMANLATKAGVESLDPENRFRIHAPIIQMSKAEIIQLGTEMGINYSQTVSCYQANTNGEACGICESCQLRKTGFIQAGISDPTRYQAHIKN